MQEGDIMTKFTGSWTKEQGGFTNQKKVEPKINPWVPAGRKQRTLKGSLLDRYIERSLQLLPKK